MSKKMNIDELISALSEMRKKVGGNETVAFVSTFGENDAISPTYPIVGDFENCDGDKFKCGFICDSLGDEFTEVGKEHYEWKPSKNKMEYEPFRFDGYVHIAPEDRAKFPEPTIVDMSNEILTVKFNAYWEDCELNGNRDFAIQPLVSGYDGNNIIWNIEPKTGTILNWKKGDVAKTWYKVVDEFEYDYGEFHYGPDYVPEFMAIWDSGWGDYVKVEIDGNGKIKDWSYEKFLKKFEEHKEEAND